MDICKKCGEIRKLRTRSNGGHWYECIRCARERYHERMKNPEYKKIHLLKCYEWSRDNPEKIKIIAHNWQQRHPDKANANATRWRKNNPEKAKAIKDRFELANKERMKLLRNKWREDHRELVNKRNRLRMQNHKGERAMWQNRRRARVNKSVTNFTNEEIVQKLKKQSYRCIYCNIDISDRFHRDHKIPIALGGDNSINNIDLLCQDCNKRKHTKTPVEFRKYLKIQY